MWYRKRFFGFIYCGFKIKFSLKNCLINKYESEGKRAKSEEKSKNGLLDKITEKTIVPLPWNILFIRYQ